MIDESNMYKVLEDFPNQIREGYKLAENIDIQVPVESVVVAGMGGSALPGEIMKTYVDMDKPFHWIRNYNLPKHVNKKTLVIVISYSGNTEEALSCFRQALRIGCPVIAISSGGKLAQFAEKQDVEYIKIPRGIQPRSAYGYLFFSLLRILENSGYIEKQKDYVDKTIKMLNNNIYKDHAKKIVDKIIKKVPIIYCSEKNWSIAYKWKINFNENAKIHAFYNVFPELNHNEMLGFSHMFADYAVIIIRDEDDYFRIKKRMDITKKMIKQQDCNVVEVAIKGSCRLAKIFSAIYIGDWVSYFLALKYETDPTPVALIEEFKKQLV
mgnify:CR=1 FL=1